MRVLKLNISRSEASRMLKSNLRVVSMVDAFKVLDEMACYGDVYVSSFETRFSVVHGSTGYTTAEGWIFDSGDETCEVVYDFAGPFWSFLARSTLNFYFKKLYGPHIQKAEAVTQKT